MGYNKATHIFHEFKVRPDYVVVCRCVCFVLFFHSNFCVSTAENRLEFQCYQVRMTEGDSEEQRNWNICKKVILRTDLVIMPNKKGDEVKE